MEPEQDQHPAESPTQSKLFPESVRHNPDFLRSLVANPATLSLVQSLLVEAKQVVASGLPSDSSASEPGLTALPLPHGGVTRSLSLPGITTESVRTGLLDCKFCGTRFQSSELLAKHQCSRAGGKTKLLLACDFCARRYSDNPRIVPFRSSRISADTEAQDLACSICGTPLRQEVGSAAKVEAELKARTTDGLTRLHDCKICGAHFNRSDRLLAHSRVHTGEKPFPCDLCNRSFSRKDRLKIHLESHNGESRFRCKICEKPFTQSHHLQKHMEHHNSNSASNFGPPSRAVDEAAARNLTMPDEEEESDGG
eukprot:m.56555 g.56555  ORF g.56555 m.56555 type:complete len:310 (-) comp48953_c0_seq2:233-1162(-)